MNTPREKSVCVFGEVLFDHFPGGETVMGGAPFNVAWHLQGLGFAPLLLSRIGADPEGEKVLHTMSRWGMDTTAVQHDPQRPTGRVTVDIVAGEPHYQIDENCAWDALEPAPGAPCDVLYHGSLAARSPQSAHALAALRASRPELVFVDVNLRPPWWQPEQLESLLQGAHWVKLNTDELSALQGESTANAARLCLQRFNLHGLIVTRGADGAELLSADGSHLHAPCSPGIEVVDTVGAGDAFAAVMLAGLVAGWDMQATLARAQQFAGKIVANRGATLANCDTYLQLLREWGEAN